VTGIQAKTKEFELNSILGSGRGRDTCTECCG